MVTTAHEEPQSFALSSVHLKSEANDWKARMEQFAFQDSKVSQHHTSTIIGDFNFLFKREEVSIITAILQNVKGR